MFCMIDEMLFSSSSEHLVSLECHKMSVSIVIYTDLHDTAREVYRWFS